MIASAISTLGNEDIQFRERAYFAGVELLIVGLFAVLADDAYGNGWRDVHCFSTIGRKRLLVAGEDV